jgi:hypothetical protein
MRLKVVPITPAGGGPIPSYLEGFRVVNRSEFPVEIAEAGVIQKEGKNIVLFPLEPGAQLVVAARSSHTVKASFHVAVSSGLDGLTWCYVETADGRIIKARIKNPTRIELRLGHRS